MTLLEQPARLSSPPVPSKYQEDVFCFQRSGSGNARVVARAGSGKTTTLVLASHRLSPGDRGRAAFVAFNRHIADELRSRLPDGMDASTIHSLALRTLKRALKIGSKDWVDDRKYARLTRQFWKDRNLDTRTHPDVIDDTRLLLRYAMLTLTDTADKPAMRELAAKYGVEAFDFHLDTYIDATGTILGWGLNGTPDGKFKGMTETISFDDMVYLPAVLDVSVPQFEFLYIDECQDLNAAQREFLLKMLASGGRAIFVGDPAQAIYGFAGADTESFDRIKDRASTVDLSLPICYRCPSSHIALAQELVPDIQAREGAPIGMVEYITEDALFQGETRVREGDLILCRCTAPLISFCFELISGGIPAKVRGRDIGTSLSRIVDQVVTSEGYFGWEYFGSSLEEVIYRTVSALKQREDNDLAIESYQDRANSLRTIWMRALSEGVRDTDALKAYVESLFSDQRGIVTLSTVHKAKGLEADRVFILRPELIPHPKAKRAWEYEQEHNLKYVALTRSKRDLYFVYCNPR